MKSKLIVACITVAALWTPSLASGQSIFDDSVSTCTGANCSSLRIPATIFAFGPSAGVFTIDVFATPGQCVRLDLTSPASPDMEMVVVAPNGTVFRNDDRNGSLDRRPLVKIGSAPINGWYTVHISQFAGVATETNMVLLYGRYNGGNPNCAAPTPATVGGAFESLSLEDDDAKTSDDAPAAAPKPGAPGSGPPSLE
jgi:hypothetical protein